MNRAFLMCDLELPRSASFCLAMRNKDRDWCTEVSYSPDLLQRSLFIFWLFLRCIPMLLYWDNARGPCEISATP